MRTLLRIMLPILNFLLCITLPIIVITWTATNYSIKIAPILGIGTTNCLIPPMNTELIGIHKRTRESDEYLLFRSFPKENLTTT